MKNCFNFLLRRRILRLWLRRSENETRRDGGAVKCKYVPKDGNDGEQKSRGGGGVRGDNNVHGRANGSSERTKKEEEGNKVTKQVPDEEEIVNVLQLALPIMFRAF